MTKHNLVQIELVDRLFFPRKMEIDLGSKEENVQESHDLFDGNFSFDQNSALKLNFDRLEHAPFQINQIENSNLSCKFHNIFVYF